MADKALSSSSSSAMKTLTQPDNPPNQGDKPYFIADILASYNLSPSDINKQLQRALEWPIHLKVAELKPDRDIITILKSSKTLTQRSETLTPQLPLSAPNRHFTVPGMTVIEKLIYRECGFENEVNCSRGWRCCTWLPHNLDRIEKMTSDGALFILLVSDHNQIVNGFCSQVV